MCVVFKINLRQEMELHIPMAQFGLALQVVMKFVNETRHNVNFIVGVRFMPRDSAGIWLVRFARI